MKVFSIAAAVTLVLAFVSLLESSALPLDQVQETEGVGMVRGAGMSDTPAAANEETSVDQWITPYHARVKRGGLVALCRYCCNCCRSNSGCGFCCKY
uniref:Hepcidin n=1 Tax=Cynoglossus semilaevis TaxID=244447 RepID=I3WA10_CYNSE|nr:hepcidin [Cynoglossus semilaevis]